MQGTLSPLNDAFIVTSVPYLDSIFSFTAGSLETAISLAIIISFLAFGRLCFTGAVLDVIFWGELLLVSSTFGIALLSGIFNLSFGNGYAVLLLVAAAAEAGVGMLLVLEVGNFGVFKKLDSSAVLVPTLLN